MNCSCSNVVSQSLSMDVVLAKLMLFLIPSLAFTTPFPFNKLSGKISPSKGAPSAPINMLKKPPFCYFVSFLIVLVTLFIKIF